MLRTALALIALSAPATALAQTAPVPQTPERWVPELYKQCHDHHCYAEGTVRFVVTVSAAGRITACTILTSSGNWRLDEDTCTILSRHARFIPAQDAHGRPVAGQWESQMHWRVPGTQPSMVKPQPDREPG